MTADKQSEYNRKLQTLRNTFITQMPGRLDEARLIFEGMNRGAPVDKAGLGALHRFFHTIKGTGNSFGFKDFGAVAAAGESWLEKQAQEGGEYGGEFLQAIEKSFGALERCLAQLQAQALDASLQQVTAAASGEVSAAVPVPAARSALVYVCDDDLVQGELISSQLRYFGYRVRNFHETADLQQAIGRQRPDAVVMDIMFPEGACHGTDVLSGLHARGIEFPSIFMSSRSDVEARLRAIRAGGQAYFTKPVEALDLLGILDRLTSQTELAPYKILVIDDELPVAQYHALILENAGMQVEILQNPEHILDVVSSFKPDLVLMDMYMPYCTGQEAAALIRQIPEFLSLPIIFLSGETDKDKQFTAMSVGVEGFLTKPIQADELVSSVMLSADRMRALQSLMTRDSLTGLFNHTTTTQLLESTLSNARRGCSPMCFAMIDLDRFKQVNDNFGHPMGDQVLLAMARVLRQRLRVSDLVGRFGGEEFAVILGNIGRDTALELMNSLRVDFSHIVFQGAGTPFSCTFSCGIASSEDHETAEGLREAADRALYRAKDAGRNRIVFDAQEKPDGA